MKGSRLKLAARLAAIVGTLLGAVPLYYASRTLGVSNPWPRKFLGATGRLSGARVRCHGTPLQRGAVLIANHVSWLDIPVLAGATGTAFVAHDGLAENASLKWLCEMNRTIFIARGERGRVAEQVNQIREAIGAGGTLTVFAEGTTSDGTGLLPFKSALLSALESPPNPILVQPVWLDYGPRSEEVAWYGDEPGLSNVLRILARLGSLEINVHFLEPFDPAARGSRKAIAAEARTRIEARMAAFRSKPTPRT